MNAAEKIKAANDPKLIKAAIEFHLSESDRLYHEGLFDESRRNRYIVQSLKQQLGGYQDPTQARVRTIDDLLD
jgi:hypothetical protein